MKTIVKLFTLTVALFWTVSLGYAQSINFNLIANAFGSEPTIEVNLKGSLLRMATIAIEEEDEEFAGLLKKMRGIYVRGYELNANNRNVEKMVSDMSRRLSNDGWETMVKVREEDETVYVMIRENGNLMMGMTVMVLDYTDEEAIFVNIDGDIDPAEISRIGKKFNIDAMSDIDINFP